MISLNLSSLTKVSFILNNISIQVMILTGKGKKQMTGNKCSKSIWKIQYPMMIIAFSNEEQE
jgi:hypothetical protein